MTYGDDPLESVWTTYVTTQSSFKVTKRVSGRKDLSLLSKTNLVPVDGLSTTSLINSARDELEDLLILAMWAKFERYLIEYIQGVGAVLDTARPVSLAGNLHEKFELSVESWKSTDVIDLFKDIVDENLRGHAKNIKKYRDYIAHKNPRNEDAPKTDPATAYRVLSNFILVIRSEAS
ncbi:MAG: hypothetical protein ACP5VS_05655 [Desulfomonilaceae bacterium]